MEKRHEAPLMRGSMEREGWATMEGRERATRGISRHYEASLSGCVDTLNQLMKEDGLTLARLYVTCFDETPLHIAAMLGHVDFAAALVSSKWDLVTKLDSRGFSPLHLASANGHVEIVKTLLLVNTDVCLFLDEDRRTPLHLAVMHGQEDVIKELVPARPEAIEYKLDMGETLLHSCVKHNRLGALKLLVEIERIDDDFINYIDDDGNTVLHMATALKQEETIKYLPSKAGVKVNAVNGNGFTALDTIEHTPRDFKGMEIREYLLNAGALRARNIPSSAPNTDQVITESEISPVIVNLEAIAPPSDVPPTATVSQPPSRGSAAINKHLKNHEEWLKENRETLMVAATVIAAMAYQAGLNPPGGLWQEDKEGDPNGRRKYAGQSVLHYQSPTYFRIFWVCNTVSFVASLSIILLIVSGIPRKRARKIVMWMLIVAMWITITFMLVTYFSSLIAISTSSFDDMTIWMVIVYSVCIWLAMIGIVLLVYIGRFLKWSFRKVRQLRKSDFQDLCLRVKAMSKCTRFVKLSSRAPLN